MSLDLRTVCILVAVAAVLPYLVLPSLPLIYDADPAIVQNEALREAGPSGLVLTDFWGESPQAAHGTRSWRPLVSLSWALQMRLFGQSAVGFHLVDMLLHAAAAALFVVVLAAGGIGAPWLLAAGLLFALHPVQSDAVASAVGRADVMAGLCLFGALALHLRAPGHPRAVAMRAGTVALLAAGLLCKEYAVAFPFILVVVDLARRATGLARGDDRRLEHATWGGAFAVLAAYLLARLLLFGTLSGASASADVHPLADQSLVVRWATSFAILPLALRLLVVPVWLNHHYRFGTLEIPQSLLDWRALVGLVLAGLLVAAAVAAIRSKRDALPAIASALVLLPLVPSLHFLSVVNVLFAERFLYIPVAGAAMAAAWALQRWAAGAQERIALAAVAVVLVAFGGLTYARVGDWASMERLARSSLDAYPGGADPWKQIAVAMLREGRVQEALDPLERALERNERDAQAWSLYAEVLKRLERYADAGAALRRVIDLAPEESGLVLREAGQVELLAGRAYEAVVPLARAHELMPADARTLHMLAQAYIRSGRPQEAISALRAGTAAMETDPEALQLLLGQAMLRTAQLRVSEGREEDALFWTKQAVESGTLPAAGVFLAGLVARKAGDDALGKELLERAQNLDGQLIRKKYEAAVQLAEAGSFDEAIAQFEEILTALPDHYPTLFNLGRTLVLAGRPKDAIAPLEHGLRQFEDPDARVLLEQARSSAG